MPHVSQFIHLVVCISCMNIFNEYVYWMNIFNEYITIYSVVIYLCILMLMNICIVSRFLAYKSGCSEHCCTSLFCGDMLSFLLDKQLTVEVPSHRVDVYFLVRNWHSFSQWLFQLTPQSAMNEGSSCYTSLPTFDIASLFYFSHTVPGDIEYLSIGHLYIIFVWSVGSSLLLMKTWIVDF